METPATSTVSPRKAVVGTGEDQLDHMDTPLPILMPHPGASLRPIPTPGSSYPQPTAHRFTTVYLVFIDAY